MWCCMAHVELNCGVLSALCCGAWCCLCCVVWYLLFVLCGVLYVLFICIIAGCVHGLLLVLFVSYGWWVLSMMYVLFISYG